MKNLVTLKACFIIIMLSVSCSKKSTPQHTAPSPEHAKDSVAVKKTVAAHKVAVPAPSVIVVNDAAAKKTVDGRFYYDLNGKRYWRSNKDGKYYLFNKSMYSDPDFKPQR